MRHMAQLSKLYGQLTFRASSRFFYSGAHLTEGREVLMTMRRELPHNLGMDALYASSGNIWPAARLSHQCSQVDDRTVILSALDAGLRLTEIHDDVEVSNVLMAVTPFIALMTLLLSIERSGLVELEACRRSRLA